MPRVAILAVALTSCSAATPTTQPAATPSREVAKAEAFASKEWRFTAGFPSIPAEKKLKDALGIDYVVFMALDENCGYSVAVWKLPIPAGESDEIIHGRLTASRDASLKHISATLKTSRRVKFDNKYPGLEYTATVANPAPDVAEGVIRTRSYIADARLYAVSVVGPKEPTAAKAADAFLDPFKITE
jgi:hypothetical protein